jgi:undecaprenyl diphosphate synthase
MMLRAAEACSRNSSWSRQSFSEALGSPDVDLIIRTAGEKRLSDFLLWECAYAEFEFLDVLWPDMDRWHLEGALASFRQRDRRYGGLTQNALQPEPVAR